MILNISGIEVNVVRRNIKSVSMRIRPGTNAADMSVPMRMPKAEIVETAKKLLERIAKRQGQTLEEFSRQLKQDKHYSDGEKAMLWGREYTLRIIKVRTPRDIFSAYAGKELPEDVIAERLKYDIPKIELKGSEAFLYVPFCPPKIEVIVEEELAEDPEECQEEENPEDFLFDMSPYTRKEPEIPLKKPEVKKKTTITTFFIDDDDPDAEPTEFDRKYAFYASIRKLLFDKIEILLPKWEAKTGMSCKSWGIRNVATYWGIYRHDREHIDFNINLAHKPTECLEYIILHELAHSKQMNHGQKFKAILDKFMPDWRKTSQQLKKLGD